MAIKTSLFVIITYSYTLYYIIITSDYCNYGPLSPVIIVKWTHYCSDETTSITHYY